MSSQPSHIGEFPPEAADVHDDLVFGKDPQSSLVIPKALVADLWAQVNEGMRMLARGGLEVGGLLVGPKVCGGPVVVAEIIPLPIEYRRGPSFLMSSSDLAGIAPAIESAHEDRSKPVVGFYRGRTRGDTALRESDQEIFDAIEGVHASFADDFRCFFVLAPMSESMAFASIAMRDGGDWKETETFTLRSNPLSIVALPASTALQQMSNNWRTEGQAIQSPLSSSAEQSITVQRGTEHRLMEHRAAPFILHRSGARNARIWLYAAASLVAIAFAAGGAYRWALRKHPQPAPSVRTETLSPRAHLGFSATREGTAWKLSWDRAAMDALDPAGATLIVEDGGYQQQVPLATADLASGTLFYTPQSNDLTFGLRIDRGGSHVEEHIRILEASPDTQPSDPTAQAIPGKGSIPMRTDTTGVTPRRERPAVSSVPTAAPPASASPNPSPSLPPAPALANTAKEPAIAPTIARGAKSISVPIAQPPVLALAIPVPPIEPSATPNVAFTPATAPAVSAPSTGTSPVPSNRTAPVPIPPAPTPGTSKATYVAPKPIQQVRPKAPAGKPSDVSQVQVLVEVDKHGKVTKVSPVGWSATNAPLMVSAIRAASSWVFAPAQSDGHAVPSQVNLIFQF